MEVDNVLFDEMHEDTRKVCQAYIEGQYRYDKIYKNRYRRHIDGVSKFKNFKKIEKFKRNSKKLKF